MFILHFLRKSRTTFAHTEKNMQRVDLAKDWRIVLKFKLGIFKKRAKLFFHDIEKFKLILAFALNVYVKKIKYYHLF